MAKEKINWKTNCENGISEKLTDEKRLKDFLETLSDDEIRKNKEASAKFDWIVSRISSEDLWFDPHWFNVKRSTWLPRWYSSAENKPYSTLTVTIPPEDTRIYIEKTLQKKGECCNFHMKVVENGKTTFDKEFTEFGGVVSALDRVSLILSRHWKTSRNRAEELLGSYTGW